jgi:DNA polymerase-3 subunit delta'
VGFETILGHERALRTLRGALRGERLHHAWLFSGPEGVGKALVAQTFARALLCEAKPEVAPCGECDACQRVQRGVHPDLLVVRPESERVTRGELSRDALEGSPSREIRIAEVRSLERRLRLGAQRGSGRVVAILEPAERMNLAAQNALLKTLEEPPPGAVLVLVCGAEGVLLPTVRSRCLRLPFGPLSDDLVAREVQARLSCDAETAASIATLAGGSLGRALALGAEGAERRREALEVLRGLGGPAGADLLAVGQAAARWSRDREEAEGALEIAELYLRDLLLLASGGEARALRNQDEANALAEIAGRRAPLRIVEALEAVDHARAALARNANLRLTLERALARVAEAL